MDPQEQSYMSFLSSEPPYPKDAAQHFAHHFFYFPKRVKDSKRIHLWIQQTSRIDDENSEVVNLSSHYSCCHILSLSKQRVLILPVEQSEWEKSLGDEVRKGFIVKNSTSV